MTKLHDLYREHGQSPWLDNVKRGWITGGELRRRVEQGIRGITSNPTIFQKAISAGDDYDEQFGDLVRSGATVEESYWQLVQRDIQDAVAILRPVYDESDGEDGFVSIELAPDIALDADASVRAARQLHDTIAQPNLYVKIPGTAEGVRAIRTVVGEGRNINVTLLFGLERYGEVIEAYIAGLEEFAAAGGDLHSVRSVASFFVSRVDTEVDRRLEQVGTEEALALRGKAAVANAKLANALFRERFSGSRWNALAAAGGNPQRPLWASTSTKNPAYPDTMYVDALIGPDTVNTMPEDTIDAFIEHGALARTVDRDTDAARALLLERLPAVGVDMRDVTRTLEEEGVASFAKSFDELLTTLETKAADLKG